MPDKCQDYICKFLLTIGFKRKVASHSKRNKTVFCIFGENAIQMLLGILWRLCDFMTLRLVVLSCSLCPPRTFMSIVDSLQSLHPAIHADEPDELTQASAFIYSVFIFPQPLFSQPLLSLAYLGNHSPLLWFTVPWVPPIIQSVITWGSGLRPCGFFFSSVPSSMCDTRQVL